MVFPEHLPCFILLFSLLIVSIFSSGIWVSNQLQKTLPSWNYLLLVHHLGNQLFSSSAFNTWGHFSSWRPKPEFLRTKIPLLIISVVIVWALFILFLSTFPHKERLNPLWCTAYHDCQLSGVVISFTEARGISLHSAKCDCVCLQAWEQKRNDNIWKLLVIYGWRLPPH